MKRANNTHEAVEQYKNNLGNLNKRIYSNEFGAKEIEERADYVKSEASQALTKAKEVLS